MNMPEGEPERELQLYRVRLPGFVSDEEIGLGDVIMRATHTFGIRPCSGCERRAAGRSIAGSCSPGGPGEGDRAEPTSRRRESRGPSHERTIPESAGHRAVDQRSRRRRGGRARLRRPEAGPLPDLRRGSSSAPVSYVYAIGSIVARALSLSVEKEFAQATVLCRDRGAERSGGVRQGALQAGESVSRPPTLLGLDRTGARDVHPAPSRPQGFRSARGGHPAATQPHGPRRGHRGTGADRRAGALQRAHGPDRPLRPGVLVRPGRALKAIPRPEGVKAGEFEAAAGDVFDRILLMADNAGSADGHRALNYLAMRLSRDLRQGDGTIRARLLR